MDILDATREQLLEQIEELEMVNPSLIVSTVKKAQ